MSTLEPKEDSCSRTQGRHPQKVIKPKSHVSDLSSVSIVDEVDGAQASKAVKDDEVFLPDIVIHDTGGNKQKYKKQKLHDRKNDSEVNIQFKSLR